MDLKEVQTEIEKRWGSSEYSDEFNARPDVQRDAHHAALHITKALGKLASELDDLDHKNGDPAPAVVDVSVVTNALADIVICAARVASKWPEARIDLNEAVRRRIEAKFPPLRSCSLHADCNAADAAQRKVDRETVAKHEPKPRTCNRHSDCDVADEVARSRGAIGAEHCHNECCEECFGY